MGEWRGRTFVAKLERNMAITQTTKEAFIKARRYFAYRRANMMHKRPSEYWIARVTVPTEFIDAEEQFELTSGHRHDTRETMSSLKLPSDAPLNSWVRYQSWKIP